MMNLHWLARLEVIGSIFALTDCQEKIMKQEVSTIKLGDPQWPTL